MSSNTTYYEYNDVKERIVHWLQKLGGWTIFSYSETESDPYTDYYSPFYWCGLAEKNGYILCVDCSRAEEARMGTRYTEKPVKVSASNAEKIKKLEQITQARGATESEERTAKEKISVLMGKTEEANAERERTKEEYLEWPGHMANPPRKNWHIEKDGVIIDSGTGLLKFAGVPDIYKYERDLKDWQEFNNLLKDSWIGIQTEYRMHSWNESEEQARRNAEYSYEIAEKKYKLLAEFNELISRIDSACGNRCGEAEFHYEKVKEKAYRKVNKAKESSGDLKIGQCFKVNANFNHGVSKGDVYRIERISESYLTAYKFNGKLTKLCTGTANRSNSFYTSREKFRGWINKGALVYCTIVEEKEEYEVEKVKKVSNKPEEPKKEATKVKAQAKQKATKQAENPGVDFEITEGTREGAYEIYFEDKPSTDILTALKELGMRWNNKKKCWYGFVECEDIKAAVEAA